MSLVSLKDVSEIVRGVTFSKAEGSGTDTLGRIPVIRAGSIQRTLLVNEGQIWVEESKVKEHQLIRKNDIIMCTSSGSADLVGKCAISVDDHHVSFGAFCAGIRPNPTKVSPSYLYHFLNSPKFRNWTKNSSGANIKNIRASELGDFKFELPSLDEQKRIAAILDKADAIRRKRQQAIQLADDFLRSVFLDMFGDPVTNPKGWEVKKFSDLGNWASGGTPSRSVSGYFEGEINWFSARELNHRYLNESVEKITDEALSKSAAKIFPAGSMLVGMYDTAAFKISILNVASASNQACANIIPNEKIDIEWFFSFIEFSKETYLRQRRGVRQQNLNLGMIKDFDLPLPPKTEQEKFVKLAHKTMQMKERNYSSLSNSLDNFNSLSQKAFAGEL